MVDKSDERLDLVFKALASEPRRAVLRILAGRAEACGCNHAEDEVCACVFAEKLGLGASTVSHHMRTLIDAGLVSSSKRGLWVYYRLAPDAFTPLAEELAILAAGTCPPAAPTA